MTTITDQKLDNLQALCEAAEKYIQIQEKAASIQSQRGNCLEYWETAKQIDDYGDVFRAEAQPQAVLALIKRVRELERALEPFASPAMRWAEHRDTPTIEEFERAASAMKGEYP